MPIKYINAEETNFGMDSCGGPDKYSLHHPDAVPGRKKNRNTNVFKHMFLIQSKHAAGNPTLATLHLNIDDTTGNYNLACRVKAEWRGHFMPLNFWQQVSAKIEGNPKLAEILPVGGFSSYTELRDATYGTIIISLKIDDETNKQDIQYFFALFQRCIARNYDNVENLENNPAAECFNSNIVNYMLDINPERCRSRNEHVAMRTLKELAALSTNQQQRFAQAKSARR